MGLPTPETVERLQAALHAKAKRDPEFRFYTLYDKLYRMDILGYAYAINQTNRGAAGVDRQTFEEIKSYGVERWLGELAEVSLGPVGCAYRRIDQHVRHRFRRWLCNKHKIQSKGYGRWGCEYFTQVGLVNLRDRVRNASCAKA